MLNDDEEQSRHRVGERAFRDKDTGKGKDPVAESVRSKARGGEMGVDGVSERRKKGVQGDAGTVRNGQTGVLIDHSGRQPYPGDRAANMV